MTLNKWQMAALIALAAGGAGAACLADIKIRNKNRPIFTSTESKDKQKEDLEKMVWGSQTWTFNKDEISAELRDYRLPHATKFYFTTDGDEKQRKSSEAVYNDFQNQLLLPLYNKLEPAIGNRGFTGSEMLQLLSFYVDKLSRGEDRYVVTRTEVNEAIRKLNEEGPECFKIRLEKMLEEKTPVASKNKKDVIENVKEQERHAYEGFKDGQRYADQFKKGYRHEETRASLDAYAQWRQATIDAELNSRLWRNSPRYCPNR